MKFNNRKHSGAAVINLTPLIDCMFLLVIFIMLIARFEPDGGIPVDLPKSSSGEARVLPTRINLTVTSDGRVYMEQEEVPVADLERYIIDARTKAGDPEGKETVLVVYGDKEAHHGTVVEVLDAAARAKHQKVTIRTIQ